MSNANFRQRKNDETRSPGRFPRCKRSERDSTGSLPTSPHRSAMRLCPAGNAGRRKRPTPTGVDLAIGLKHMSGIPLPWFRSRRCTRFNFTGPCPGAGSLVTALPINILPLRVLSWLAGHSRGLGVGRSRSRSDRLGDCPDETDEFASRRRDGDVLEFAPPAQIIAKLTS